MDHLRINRPDKPRRDAILNQVRINSQFNVTPKDMWTDISDLDEKSRNDLNNLTLKGLRDVSTAFDVCKKRDEDLQNQIRLLEIQKYLNDTRGEFLKELITKKQYNKHSKFIGECVEEYELNLNNNDQRRRDEDEFVDDLLNNRLSQMSTNPNPKVGDNN